MGSILKWQKGEQQSMRSILHVPSDRGSSRDTAQPAPAQLAHVEKQITCTSV